MIEGGTEVGGLCILRGCMPTKALLYAAEVKHLAEHAGTWGLRTSKVGFNFTKVMARKDAQIEDFAGYRRKQLNRQVQIHPGGGKLFGPAYGGAQHGR